MISNLGRQLIGVYGFTGNLATGTIIIIVVSAVLSFLGCLLLPLCVWCCLKRRRSEREIPVVYTGKPVLALLYLIN